LKQRLEPVRFGFSSLKISLGQFNLCFPGLQIGARHACFGLCLVERLSRGGLAGEELLLPLEGYLLQVEIGLYAGKLPLCHFERGLGLLHGRLGPLELRLQLRVLDHRQHLPPFHMVADIIVDL
jgi:hypothetical protein